jgi:hypothetical protein
MGSEPAAALDQASSLLSLRAAPAPTRSSPADPASSVDESSASPRKRTTRKRFRAALIEALEQPGENGAESKLQEIADALVTKAAGGDLAAIKEVLDRLDGKTAPAAPDTDAEPVRVTFRWKGIS